MWRLLIALALLCGVGRADTIQLVSGSRMVGRIIRETKDEVVIEMECGRMTFPRSRIAKIERDRPEPAGEAAPESGPGQPAPADQIVRGVVSGWPFAADRVWLEASNIQVIIHFARGDYAVRFPIGSIREPIENRAFRGEAGFLRVDDRFFETHHYGGAGKYVVTFGARNGDWIRGKVSFSGSKQFLDGSFVAFDGRGGKPLPGDGEWPATGDAHRAGRAMPMALYPLAYRRFGAGRNGRGKLGTAERTVTLPDGGRGDLFLIHAPAGEKRGIELIPDGAVEPKLRIYDADGRAVSTDLREGRAVVTGPLPPKFLFALVSGPPGCAYRLVHHKTVREMGGLHRMPIGLKGTLTDSLGSPDATAGPAWTKGFSVKAYSLQVRPGRFWVRTKWRSSESRTRECHVLTKEGLRLWTGPGGYYSIRREESLIVVVLSRGKAEFELFTNWKAQPSR